MSAAQRDNSSRLSGVFSVAGWARGKCASCASSLTGEARSRCPRPAGRSGCVSTPTTRCADDSNVRSAGSANCGVPAKAIRSFVFRSVSAGGTGFARLAGAFLAILVQLLADALALEVGEVVDEQFRFQVGHFGLQADRRQAVQIRLERFAGGAVGPGEGPRVG